MRHIASVKDDGEKLLSFLNRTVEDGDTVVVTGHSKAGALATAAALWLDESLACRKNVQCFSFAGPTAGNAAFVERYNARLQGRTRRIGNPLDVVPQAWVPSELSTLARSYPLLGTAIDVVITLVKDLNYTHVGGQVLTIPSKPMTGLLAAQLAYQHLDAYLQA